MDASKGGQLRLQQGTSPAVVPTLRPPNVHSSLPSWLSGAAVRPQDPTTHLLVSGQLCLPGVRSSRRVRLLVLQQQEGGTGRRVGGSLSLADIELLLTSRRPKHLGTNHSCTRCTPSWQQPSAAASWEQQASSWQQQASASAAPASWEQSAASSAACWQEQASAARKEGADVRTSQRVETFCPSDLQTSQR